MGFPEWLPSDSLGDRVKHLVVRGSPGCWCDLDLAEFLESQSWTQIRITSKRGGCCHVLATPPPGHPQPTCWRYELEGEKKPWLIEVQVAVQPPRKLTKLQAVKGPARAPRDCSEVSMNEARGPDEESSGNNPIAPPRSRTSKRAQARSSNHEVRTPMTRTRSWTHHRPPLPPLVPWTPTPLAREAVLLPHYGSCSGGSGRQRTAPWAGHG